MKFFIYLLLFTVIAVFGLTFTLQNSQVIELHYYQDLVISAPLSVVLLLTLSLGVVFGMLMTWVVALRNRRELSRIRKENRKLVEEIQKLNLETSVDR